VERSHLTLSLIIPVYKNEENLERPLASLNDLNQRLSGALEIVVSSMAVLIGPSRFCARNSLKHH